MTSTDRRVSHSMLRRVRQWLRENSSPDAESVTVQMAERANTPYDDLRLDPPPRQRTSLLLGGCVAENLASAGKSLSWLLDHQLYQSGLHESPEWPPESVYEAALVVFSLRTVLGQAASRINGIHDADLAYLKHIPEDRLFATAQEVLDALVEKIHASANARLPLFFLSFFEPPQTASGLFQAREGLYPLVRRLNEAMAALLWPKADTHYLEANDLLRAFGDVDVYDGYDVCFAHAGIKVGIDGVQGLSAAILRRIDKMLSVIREEVESVKLIVTDLDNTLWIGVVAEATEIVPHRQTEGWPLGYAEALLICKQRGILLAICSKNDEETTRANFEKVWGGRLQLDDFCSVKINWRPKPENMAQILQETNLLPENVLFIDDNPLEIEEMQQVFPEVRTLTGDPRRWRMELIYAAPFQRARITEESASRTALIRAKMERDRTIQATDREEFLNSLGLTAIVSAIECDSSEYQRAMELLNKTNQFNTTGKRWNDGEMREFLANGGRMFIMQARDRLANHGLIAVALVRESTLVQMVLSCRVFGLGLEEAMLVRLLDMSSVGGSMSAGHRDTGKNATALQFLRRHFLLDQNPVSLASQPQCPAHIHLS